MAIMYSGENSTLSVHDESTELLSKLTDEINFVLELSKVENSSNLEFIQLESNNEKNMTQHSCIVKGKDFSITKIDLIDGSTVYEYIDDIGFIFLQPSCLSASVIKLKNNKEEVYGCDLLRYDDSTSYINSAISKFDEILKKMK